MTFELDRGEVLRPVREELIERFDALLVNAEDTSTTQTYASSEYKHSWLRSLGVLPKRWITRTVDSETAIINITDEEFLKGPYRTATRGEIAVVHTKKDTIAEAAGGKILSERPECYTLSIVDLTDWPEGAIRSTYRGTEIVEKAYTTRHILRNFTFIPGDTVDEMIITRRKSFEVIPAYSQITPEDASYKYLLRYLRLAQDLISSSEEE